MTPPLLDSVILPFVKLDVTKEDSHSAPLSVLNLDPVGSRLVKELFNAGINIALPSWIN